MKGSLLLLRLKRVINLIAEKALLENFDFIPIGFKLGVLIPVYLSALLSDESYEFVTFSGISGVDRVTDCFVFILSYFNKTAEVLGSLLSQYFLYRYTEEADGPGNPLGVLESFLVLYFEIFISSGS